MLSAPTTFAPERLFRPWQPASEAPIEGASDYIELPAVDSYQQLENDSAFPRIQHQFLNDVKQLKSLARHYVNEQYDRIIDAFHDKLHIPSDDLQECLLPLYRETRFHIHRLINHLEKQLDAPAKEQNYIARLLHNCLDEMDLCPAGVHSRIANSYVDFQAPRVELDGVLLKVRKDLFHEFIGAFMFSCQRERLMNTPRSMEVHWFNALHNLYCKPLALEPIVDPIAPENISKSLVNTFLESVPLAVNTCTIVRTLSRLWSEQLSTVLHEQGIAAWETDVITAGQITAERAQALDNGLFKPVNHLLQTSSGEALDLWGVIEESDDGCYRLNRFREKLLFWLSDHFCPSSGRIFAVIPNGGSSPGSSYIGSINDIFFWVFDQDHCLHIGQPCTLQADNHTTLTLAHLVAIDFSTWPQQVCYALLTQAMAQTESAEDIATFFLHRATSKEFSRTPELMLQVLFQQLREKLLCAPDHFMKKLKNAVVSQVVNTSKVLQYWNLRWLLDTPLMQPALSLLKEAGFDVAPITVGLQTWQITDLSARELSALLTVHDCQRLFRQAIAKNQAQILYKLLLTGHCDSVFMNQINPVKPLFLFASRGNLPGLTYLLTLSGNGSTGKVKFDWSPLNGAAKFGHTDCLAALLVLEGANVNYQDADGETPLHKAAKHGHLECIKLLLAATDINVNSADNKGNTPLHRAARSGVVACIEALLAIAGIKLNEKNDHGSTPLILAAKFSNTECLKALLMATDIDVNLANNRGSTALHEAARYGATSCIEALVAVDVIKLNARCHSGFSPLDYAAAFGRLQCLKVLLATGGISVNDSNVQGIAPLHVAALMGNTECLKALLGVADIDTNLTTTEEEGWTPLHAAVDQGHAGCVEALLGTQGIKVNKKNKEGLTALDCAMRKGRADCVELLIGAEATRKSGRFTLSASDDGHET